MLVAGGKCMIALANETHDAHLRQCEQAALGLGLWAGKDYFELCLRDYIVLLSFIFCALQSKFNIPWEIQYRPGRTGWA